ncbi:MAG: B12-binding domain-containing radical SAM protein [Armatimonadetes bacterium]|nr:B12-binding domain-containing radical SAM protein [Armatimonadota bacterium]
MKVVLLEAHDPSRPGRLFMPMGIAYVGAYLERYESDCQTFVVETLEQGLALEPDFVGVSSVTPNFPYATEMAEAIRAQRDVPVVIGGPHITGLPSSLPEAFAAGALGEGEDTFLDLVRTHRADGRLGPDNLSEIAGIVHHAEGGPRVTKPRPFIRPLDNIPNPKRDWPGVNAGGLWSFSSRGCPYRCRFCSTAEFWESYRVHSARYVIDELNAIIDGFDSHYHCFMDDLFAVNIKRLQEIVEIASTELKRKMDLTVTIRADLVNDRMCKLLKAINVKYCHLGLESGSDRVLTYLKKESTTAARNQEAIDKLSEHGICSIGSFIIGAPMEEEEDLQQTYDFIDRNVRNAKLMSFTFGPLVAFPGTAVWEDAKKKGLVDEHNIDWKSLDIDIRFFDPERYKLLAPISRDRFTYWFHRFNALWEDTRGTIPQRMAHYNRAPGEVVTGQVA